MRGGTTVCWNCYNSRFQANDSHRSSNRLSSTHPPEDISVGACGRSYLGLSPMLQVFGHQLAIEVIKSIVSTSDSVLSNGVLVTDLVNLSTQIHEVVPFPWCEICGGPKQPRLPDPELSAQLASRNNVIGVSNLLPGWIYPTTGVISRISIRSQEQGDPVAPICADAITLRPRSHLHESTRHDLSSGKGRTIGQAIISALAEAIERYSAATINSRSLFYGTIDEVPGTTFDVKTLCLYEDWQYKQPGFPFSRFDPLKPHYWVEGLWADTHESIWVPALVAYFAQPWANEESFCQVTSSGLAAGGNFDDAALRAFYELIERDAFMLTWLTNGRPRKIDSNAIDIPYVNLLIQELRSHNIEVELFLLDVGTLLPVVVALGLGNGVSIPSATVGLGAHPDISTSIAKALECTSSASIGHFGSLRELAISSLIRLRKSLQKASISVSHLV
jgi:ribosomal protein S12 methylthiotransferase accessory factor